MKIYGLVDPTTNELRYVGQTIQKLNRRLTGHILDKNINHKTCWIKGLKSKGLKPEIFLIDEVDDIKYEIFYISYFKSIGCDLLNVSSGGETGNGLKGDKHPMWGRKHTPEALEKMNRLGMKHTEETLNYLKILHTKKITIDGVEYQSLSDASRKLNMNIPMIRYNYIDGYADKMNERRRNKWVKKTDKIRTNDNNGKFIWKNKDEV